MAWIAFGFCLLLGLYLVGRWFVGARPADVFRSLRWAAAGVVVFGLIAISVSGRWNLLWALSFPAFPLLMRWRAIRSIQKNARGPSSGQASEVDTRYLRMSLDHDTGDMDGTVREGVFSGQILSDMKLGELIEFWRECALEDKQSCSVLESYLDRAQPGWRDVVGEAAAGDTEGRAGNAESPWTRDGMSADEAREILDVTPDASTADIEAAYRIEMKRAHPDQGGADWMAAKVNQAKDTLLNR